MLLAGVCSFILMLALRRPRALERFLFGIAISSLYRVIESATQGVECSPPLVAHECGARTLRCRTIGAALRAKTQTVFSTQRCIGHGEQHRLAHRQGEINLVANEWLGFGHRQ